MSERELDRPRGRSRSDQQQQKGAGGGIDRSVDALDESTKGLTLEHEHEHPDDSNLFVGDLAKGLREEHLLNAFSAYGRVLAATIKRDRNTGKNLGYGFVKMGSHREAVEAKEALHSSEIGGRSVRINWAQKTTFLFVSGVDDGVSLEQVKHVFREFGPLDEEECMVVRTGRSGVLIKFKTRNGAEAARRGLNGSLVLSSRPLKVDWNNTSVNYVGNINMMKGPLGPGRFMDPRQMNMNIVPRRIPSTLNVQLEASTAAEVTDSTIRNIFQNFGPLADVTVLSRAEEMHPTYAEKAAGREKPAVLRGVVRFPNTSDGDACAMSAMEMLNGAVIDGVKVICAATGGRVAAEVTSSNRRMPSGPPSRTGSIQSLLTRPPSQTAITPGAVFAHYANAGTEAYHHQQQAWQQQKAGGGAGAGGPGRDQHAQSQVAPWDGTASLGEGTEAAAEGGPMVFGSTQHQQWVQQQQAEGRHPQAPVMMVNNPEWMGEGMPYMTVGYVPPNSGGYVYPYGVQPYMMPLGYAPPNSWSHEYATGHVPPQQGRQQGGEGGANDHTHPPYNPRSENRS